MHDTTPTPPRSRNWTWYICGLLLLATMLNYMDRVTLNAASEQIKVEFSLSEQDYGKLETWFGYAFAAGALLFGFIADRVSVRWLYPFVLIMWSAMGFASGLVYSLESLLICRTLLGLFEAGHWPCALKTTQQLLARQDRGLGNSILQSGASVGAIAAPLVMLAFTTDAPGSWRPVFQAIGAIGIVWVVLWLLSIREHDLQPLAAAERTELHDAPRTRFIDHVFSKRFLVLFAVVVAINVAWQMFRAWLPRLLQHQHGYDRQFTQWFLIGYYVSTDVGCIIAGAAPRWLKNRGWGLDRARWSVFMVCALITACSGFVVMLPRGPALIVGLMFVGAGALGLFPCYYSLSQELTQRNQGKLSGLLGALAWAATSPLHERFGAYVDQSKSYSLGLALAGLTPLLGALIWRVLWPPHDETTPAKS